MQGQILLTCQMDPILIIDHVLHLLTVRDMICRPRWGSRVGYFYYSYNFGHLETITPSSGL